MAFLNIFGGGEQRSAAQTIPVSDGGAWSSSGQDSNAGESITEDSALSVPAIWQAVNVIAGTIAHLPLHLYKTTGEVKERDKANPLYRVIHDQPNSVHTKPAFFKWLGSRLQLEGRALVLIVRRKNGQIAGLLPLTLGDYAITQTVEDSMLKRSYRHKESGRIYKETDVLDFVLTLKGDGVSHYNPIEMNRNAIGLLIAGERYASTMFANGGVPPLQMRGKISDSPVSRERANNEIDAALKTARHDKHAILRVPTDYELSPIGFDPAKQQMIEMRKFGISESSRMFNIAPAMLHDLSGGTYSNVEQQNLNFAQQTIAPLLKIIETELNAKLFVGRNTSNFVEFDMNGLVRGDFATRMAGLSSAVQNALMTPNEARALDNRAPLDGGDSLMIQGATVPINQAGAKTVDPTAQPSDDSE